MRRTNITKITLFIYIFVFTCSLFAQNDGLFIPRNIQKAYENNTRSFDGTPGNNYWQNYSDYKIEAELYPDSSLLKGKEKIKYYNNSPDTLNEIVIRLYNDIFEPNSVRDWQMNKKALQDGIQVTKIIIDDKVIDLNAGYPKIKRTSTNLIVKLPNKLAPGNSLKMDINWTLFISKEFPLRMGNYKEGEYFVSYWYPQIAVYDDIDGWDKHDYTGTAEFYNDHSNFEFNITVPDGYLIWATGELQNGEDIFTEKIIKRIDKAKSSDSTVHIVTTEDYHSDTILKTDSKNTWKYKAEKVNDVSFGVSDSHIWDAASVEVEEGRRVLTNAVMPDSSNHYQEAAKFARATIEHFSKEFPGYPYPYPHATSFFNGRQSGGMETPMMANNGCPQGRARYVGLVAHEFAHSYFPFFMGTNERKYAFMDEGWATFMPIGVIKEFEPEYPYVSKRVTTYEISAGHEAELPPMVPSYSVDTKFSRTNFYNRPAVAYLCLQRLLGKEVFKKAVWEFIESWKEKHPIPLDFFNTISDVAGEDLSWFFRPWFYEFGYPDLKLEDAKKENDEITVNIKKLGNIPTKVLVNIYLGDDRTIKLEKSASVWKNTDSLTITEQVDSEVTKVVIGSVKIPDADRTNNMIEFK